MIRLRSTKLLSGVSAVALLAAFGATPARADLTFSGVNLYPPIVNTAETNAITVDTLALVNSDDQTGSPDQGNSIINEIDMSGTGNKITVNNATLAGGILNRDGVTITSTDLAAILLTNTAVMGGALINQGNLSGGTNAFEVNNSHVIRGMFNDVGANVIGAVNGVAVINDSSWLGGISNEGSIAGNAGDGLRLAGAATDFAGGVQNLEGGVFSGKGATAAGIDVGFGGPISSFLDDIDNAGVIQGLNGGRGIYVDATLFDGNIANQETGLIQGVGTNAYGIYLFGGAFTGSVDNSGTIQALGTGGQAVVVGGTTVFTGDVINNETGSIRAAAAAISVSSTSFLGDIRNYGFIESTGGNAVDVSTVSFTGDIFQEFGGTILGAVQGIQISSTNFTGDVENHGSVQGGTDGLRLETGAVMTGNILMSGTIVGTAGDGVRLRGTVSGSLTNLELIEGAVAGIANESAIAGGIINSGTIIGTQSIDLALATGATTVTQTGSGARLQGNLVLDQSGAELIDTFNADGGRLTGNIVGGGTDVMNVDTGTFAHVSGTASGLDQVNVNSGTALFGTTGFGVDGAGVTYGTTNSMAVANGGTAYLDDNTVIGLTTTFTANTGGTTAYFVTSNTALHGAINATGGATLGGTLLAVVDGTTFGSLGGDQFIYTNIVTGALGGSTFDDVETTALFFSGDAIYHANAADLVLNRLGFNDVLNLGTLTQNQLAVGGALENIYNGGTFGTDMEDLFNYLLSLPGGSQGEVAAIYDELGGAEHAQIQQATLRASQPFDNALGDRLDEAKLDLRGTGWAQARETRYAAAAQQRMTDAAPSNPSQGLLRGSSGVSIWGRGYGEWTNVDGDAEAQGYSQDTGGIVGGVDFAIGDNAVVGGAFGWGTSSLDFDTPRDHADVDSFEFGAYGSYGFGRLYADAQFSFAFHDVTTTRELDLGFDTFIANANYNARAWTLAGELGTIFRWGKVNLQPMVDVNYTATSTDGFIESGAGDFGLVVDDADADSFTTTLGMRFSGLWTVGTTRLVPDAMFGWRHEFADDRQGFTAAFLDDPSSPFSIVSSKISADSAVVSAGLAAGVTKGLELYVDYNGLINSEASTHNGSAGFRATW